MPLGEGPDPGSALTKFPDYFPDSCPPSAAKPPTLAVYRIVKSQPPCPDDFRSNHELRMEFKKPPKELDRCTWCGLSVFGDFASARHRMELFPKLGRYVAAATLTPERGLVMQTYKPPHFTWWCYNSAAREEGFHIIDGGEDVAGDGGTAIIEGT